jgi:hypothetical protein
MKKHNLKLVPVYIGCLNEADLTFESTHNIHREAIKDKLIFLGEPYRLVNSEHGCYIKEAEYNRLFEY